MQVETHADFVRKQRPTDGPVRGLLFSIPAVVVFWGAFIAAAVVIFGA